VSEIESFGTPTISKVRPMAAAELLALTDGKLVSGRGYEVATRSLPDLPPEVVSTLIAAYDERTSPLSSIILHHFHGAAARIASGATAFGMRQPHFTALIYATWEPGDVNATGHRLWAQDLGSLLFEGVDQIDLTGPFEVLSRIPNSTYRIYGKAAAPVRDLKGLRLTPDAALADAPPLDVLHVPGGYGQEALMDDAEAGLDPSAGVKRMQHFLGVHGRSALWRGGPPQGTPGDDALVVVSRCRILVRSLSTSVWSSTARGSLLQASRLVSMAPCASPPSCAVTRPHKPSSFTWSMRRSRCARGRSRTPNAPNFRFLCSRHRDRRQDAERVIDGGASRVGLSSNKYRRLSYGRATGLEHATRLLTQSHGLALNTQRGYDDWCRTLGRAIGKRRVDRLTGQDLRDCFLSLLEPAHPGCASI
jgi:hypothetical protein